MGTKDCGSQLICGKLDTNFEKCFSAINCKMMQDMRDATTPNSQNKVAVFMQQMIPHHVNAVNMARIMLKHVNDDVKVHPELFHIMNGVVNSQNADIHAFRSYLGGHRDAVLRDAVLPPKTWNLGAW